MAKTKIIAGIDIGSAKVATIIAQVTDSEEIRVLGVSSTAAIGVRKGQIVNIEETASSVIGSVEKAERMAGFSVDKVIAVLNGGHISCQNSHGVVAVSSPDGEIGASDVERVIDAARAISLPASREIIHILPVEFIVDGEAGIKDPIGMSGVRLEVETHLITSSSTALKNLQKVIGEIGASVSSAVFSGLAASVSVLSDTERELGVVLVDFGAGTTSVAVFVDGALVHSRSLPIGAKNITNDIAIGLRTSLETAEKIKLALSVKPSRGKGEEEEDEIDISSLGVSEGAGEKISKKTLIEGIIRPRLNEVFAMIGMELKSSGLGGRTPAGVVITGGGALTVGAQESAKRILALPARVGYPMGVTGLVEDISSPLYAATVGAVLWAARFEAPSLVSFGGITKTLEGTFSLPVRGAVGRVVEIVKSLLP